MNWLYKIINTVIVVIIIILICIIGVDKVAFSSFIFGIICWFMDRYERKRPYLEVAFKRGEESLACIIIRNVGNSPLKLTSIKFNLKFINQLEKRAITKLTNMEEIDVKIFPNECWILSLDKVVSDIIKFPETTLKVEYTYEHMFKYVKKIFKEENFIDFKCYGSFLATNDAVD